MPAGATYIFTQAQSKRALAAEKVSQKYHDFCAANGRDAGQVFVKDTVESAVALAQETASEMIAKNPEAQPVIYIGGSTYVVSEAVVLF
jgi:alkanesulfonate monooxygenase SsuD/methylene tetrahydromethanopterin reductase-like flavin-dependent oxidoreductase (luciferase family)